MKPRFRIYLGTNGYWVPMNIEAQILWAEYWSKGL